MRKGKLDCLTLVLPVAFLLWLWGGNLWAEDADPEVVQYPKYQYDDELPEETVILPGASAGMFFGKARFGDPFLSRYDAPYINYGWVDYQNYRLNIPIYKTYDSFGNYLTEGFDAFTLEEYRTRAPQPGSVLIKGKFYQDWLQHLVIADDSYAGWTTRVTIGDAIKTTFTPLTLDMARLNGIRFDGASPDNKFTLALSRISDPVKIFIGGQLPPGGRSEIRDDGVYLMGAHWESYVGDFFTFGATYVNMHRFDSLRGFRQNTQRGVAPRGSKPITIVVRFEDDSPEDEVSGAAVFDIEAHVKSKVRGRVVTETIQPSSVDGSPGVVEVGRHIEVSGTYLEKGVRVPNFVDYTFEVPEDAFGVEFDVEAANDYRISMKQTHFFITDPERRSGKGMEPPFFIVRRAEGNVPDMSNKERISFDYGMATGQTMYGVNAKLDLVGLKLRGEIVKSRNDYQYPSLIGDRSELNDMAGFITVEKDLTSKLGVGLEAFRIGPKYNSYAPKGENFFFNVARQSPNLSPGTVTNNAVYSLVDDNDDLDQWPDDWREDWDVASRRLFFQSDAGIFPAFDFDADGFPDNNRNRNGIPDYDEPFLMYFSDPEEFQFGDDFNNNGIIDAWEDDELPNYPYYKDEQGIHPFLIISPISGLDLRLGRYDIHQIAGGGKNQVNYGRLKYERTLRSLHARFDHETKRVWDDIPDPYFRHELQEGVAELAYTWVHYEDPLKMRNSLVNRGLLNTRWSPLSNLNVMTKFRYEFNSQRSQPEDRLDFIGIIGKTDYTYRVGNLDIMPRMKTQYRRIGRKSLPRPTIEDFFIAPILRLNYHLTDRSEIRIGFQGVSLLPHRFEDLVNSDNNVSRTDFLIMWFNRSEFSGYRIGTEAGWERQVFDYDLPERPDISFSRFFIRMVTGLGEAAR